MSRPDWCPEDIWDKAVSIWRDDEMDDGPTMVARAILAAEQRGAEMEREQCAAIASHWKQPERPMTEYAEPYLPFQAAHEIAAAIRNRTGE